MLMKENGYKGELNQVNPWYIPVTSNLSFWFIDKNYTLQGAVKVQKGDMSQKSVQKFTYYAVQSREVTVFQEAGILW